MSGTHLSFTHIMWAPLTWRAHMSDLFILPPSFLSLSYLSLFLSPFLLPIGGTWRAGLDQQWRRAGSGRPRSVWNRRMDWSNLDGDGPPFSPLSVLTNDVTVCWPWQLCSVDPRCSQERCPGQPLHSLAKVAAGGWRRSMRGVSMVVIDRFRPSIYLCLQCIFY